MENPAYEQVQARKAKVERSHKADSEESYRGKRFRHKMDLSRKLKRWEAEYN